MTIYLRDRHVRNMIISKARIDELYGLCDTHARELTARGIPASEIHVACTVRFDEKGYTVPSLQDVQECYEQAQVVERLVFKVETQQSQNTNRRYGSYLELTLDRDFQLCFLTVASEDRVWVEAAFSAFNDVLNKCNAWYRFIRTAWMELFIQISGIGIIFILSLHFAKGIAPNLIVENSYLLAFLFVFLLGANIWGVLQRQVHIGIQRMYPNVNFIRTGKEYLHWLPQGVVTIFLGVMLTGTLVYISAGLLGLTKSIFRF